MADKHWYVVRVRRGFAGIVAEKLRRLNLEVLVVDEVTDPHETSINPQRSEVSADTQTHANQVFCRFAAKDRLTVTTTPGVLDVLGAPKPAFVDNGVAALKLKRPYS